MYQTLPFQRTKSENKRKRNDSQMLRSEQRAEKVVEHKGDSDINCTKSSWNDLKRPGKEIEGTGDQWKN